MLWQICIFGLKQMSLSIVILHQCFMVKIAGGNYEIAIGYIDQAIAANPERMLNYKIKGDIYFNMTLYQKAVN